MREEVLPLPPYILIALEVCHPRCMCENWKGYIVKHSCQLRCLMTTLDNYMFRPLLAIFRLSLRELKALLYNVRARDA